MQGEEDKLDFIGADGKFSILPSGNKTPEYKREDLGVLLKAPSKNNESSVSAINNLLKKLPDLDNHFRIHSKIGEGTFSNVYLASLKNAPQTSEKKFAIKHLIPTSHPKRIKYELDCLNKIGGCDNVVSCDLSLRNNDCVVFVMPYLEHRKFADYVQEMTVEETKHYMKNLFLALRRVHSFNIIHRDVKPANFLYNRETKQYLLVDFGLAQPVEQCQVVKRLPTTQKKSAVEKRKREDGEQENVDLPMAKRKALQPASNQEKVDPSLKYFKEPLSAQQRKWHEAKSAAAVNGIKRQPLSSNLRNFMAANNSMGAKPIPVPPTKRNPSPFLWMAPKKPDIEMRLCDPPSAKGKTPDPAGKPSATEPVVTFQRIVPQQASLTVAGTSFVRVQNSQVQRGNDSTVFCRPKEVCGCDGRAYVCNVCLVRRPLYAPRAGTPGFRPPEVLLKSHQQTTAVDMWAAGVIMLCILSGCYPFFRADDDISTIAEFISAFGSTAIKNLSKKLGRNLIISEERKPVNLTVLCERLRARRADWANVPPDGPKCDECNCEDVQGLGCICKEKTKLDLSKAFFPTSAYHLLERLLDVDPNTRITAEAALKHPFVAFT